MHTDNIINKAKELGLDIGSSSDPEDKLRTIAEQVGIEQFNPDTDINQLEQRLNEMLKVKNVENISNNNELQGDANNNSLQNNTPERNMVNNSGDAKEKDNYKNKQKELDEKADNLNKERHNNWKKKPGENGPIKADGSNTIKKSSKDKLKDNLNYGKAKKDAIANKFNNVKSKANKIKSPKDALKDKAKNSFKNFGKKGGKVAKKGVKATGNALDKAIKILIKVIKKNPYVALYIGLTIVAFLVLFILFHAFDDDNPPNVPGYYDSDYNYNEKEVVLTTCDTESTQEISLEEYVLGATYYYTENNEYSDETIKALMIVLKTNALSKGNFSSSESSISIDDCDTKYIKTSTISGDELNKLNKLKSLYSEIEEEIFVSESYTSEITSLSSRNALDINEDILEEMEKLSSSNYSEKLEKIYNKDVTDGDDEPIEDNYRENIFVGDSRTLGMKLNGIVSDSNSVYAGAMGYSWFIGSYGSTYGETTYNCQINGIECVDKKLARGPKNIVIWLGANDAYANANYSEKYYYKFYELATGIWRKHYIYIVSVGYVDDDRSPYVKNINIKAFNDDLEKRVNGSGLNNLIYINLGIDATEMGTETADGVHYNKLMYLKIYDNILKQIEESTKISKKKKIYKLSDYCTFYEITENKAYWWPIGSSNATSDNIYGGTPSTTDLTSEFGLREINEKTSLHKGIDISGDCQSNVIIATKAGIVKTVNNTCDNNGSYGDTCGGGSGNYVTIDHEDGTSSVYAHMYPDSITVNVGDRVEQGEKLGTIGNSGSSNGCYLHFEIRVNGAPVNPLEYVSTYNPRQILKYNLSSIDDSGTTAAENKVAICKALLDSGFSTNSVAGMMVNIQAEGAFLTNNLENCYEKDKCCLDGTYGYCMHTEIGDFGSDESYTNGVDSGAYSKENFVNDAAGYGLIQWTASNRKLGLYEYAKKNNKSIGSLSVQLGYLLEELEDSSTTYKYVTGNYTAEEIAYWFCYDFERPRERETSCKERASSYTDSMLNFVKNGCS